MKNSTVWIWLLVLLLIASPGIYIGLKSKGGASSDSLHSSPTAIRPWAEDEWNKCMLPPTRKSTWTLPPQGERISEIIEEPGKVTLKLTPLNDDEFVKDIKMVDVDLTAPDSPLKLDYIGVAYVPEDADIDSHSYRTERKFYDLSGKPIPDAGLDALGVDEYHRRPWLYEHDYSWPDISVRMSLNTQDYPDQKWAAPDVFDANTRVDLCSGGMMWHPLGDPFIFGTGFRAWHDAEMIAVMDVMHGPSVSAIVPLDEDQSMTLGETNTRFRAMMDGGRGSGSGSSTNEIYFRFDTVETKKCIVILEVRPMNEVNAFTYEARTRQGTTVSAHAQQQDNGIVCLEVDCLEKDLAEIKAKYRPFRTRFVVPMGRLPGMPAENQGVADLLDVRIPYLEPDRHEINYSDRIRRVAQLMPTHSGGVSGPKPPIMRSVSPREYIQEMEASDGLKYSVDQTTWKMDVVPAK